MAEDQQSKRSSKKIPAHYGMKDYYKFFCKKYPHLEIDRATYNKIITEFNQYICDTVIENLEYNLPHRMGKIEVVKQKRKVYLNDDGKVINTNPVDWYETNMLWERSPEAKEKKILMRHRNTSTGGYVFRINYNKRYAAYKNKSVYFFKAIRNFARSLTKRINDYSKPKYDAHLKQ